MRRCFNDSLFSYSLLSLLLGHDLSRRNATCRVFPAARPTKPAPSLRKEQFAGMWYQKKTGEIGQPYGPRYREGVPVSPVFISVTEVYLPGKSFHPAPLRLADAPGTRHPARSSATTRSS